MRKLKSTHWISSILLLGVACQPLPQTQQVKLKPQILEAKTVKTKVPVLQNKNKSQKPPLISGYADVAPAKNGKTQIKLKLSFGSQRTGFNTQAINCDKATQIKASIAGFGIPTDIEPDGGNPIAISPGTCDFSATLTFSNVPIGNNRFLRIEALDSNSNRIEGADVTSTFDLTTAGVSNIEVSQRTSLPAELIRLLSVEGTDPQGTLLASRLVLAEMNTFFDTLTGVAGVFGSYTYANVHPLLVNMSQIVADLRANGGDISLLNPLNPAYQLSAGTLQVNILNVGEGDNLTVFLSDPLSNSSFESTPGTPGHSLNLNNTKPGNWDLVVIRTPANGPDDTLVIESASHTGTVNADLSLAGPAPANWTAVNGPFGGVVTALMRAPSNPNRVYVAIEKGGVYWSNDGGVNWTLADNGLPTSSSVTSFAVHPSNPDDVFAGTEGNGVYSADFSSTPNWGSVNNNLSTSFTINDLVFDNTGTRLYVATTGGVERTSVPNVNWVDISGSAGELSGKTVSDLDFYFDGSNGFLAATAPNSQEIFEKTDPHTSTTFSEISSDLNSQSYNSVKYEPSGILYAGSRNGRVFDMDDLSTVGPTFAFSTATQVHDLAFVSGSPDSLLAATSGSAVQKADAPLSNSAIWSEFLSTPAINNPFVSSLSVAGPLNTLIVGTKGGGVSKHNGTNGWAAINQNIRGQKVTSIISANTRQFVGTYGGGVFYSDDGNTWVALNNVFDNGKERFVRTLAYDSVNDTLYMGTEGAKVHALPSASTASASSAWTSFKTNMDAPNVSSLLIDTSNNKIIAGTFNPGGNASADEGFFTSCLLGQTGCNSDSNWTQVQGSRNVYSLAFKPGNTNIIYGGSNANIYKSTNNGASWTALNPPFSGDAVSLATTSSDDNRIYAGLTGDSSPLVYSTDEGTNWNFSSGIFSEVLTVQPDTSDPDLIYVGTESGVFRTRDGGSNWTDYNTAPLNNFYASALSIHTNGYLYVGTVGHSLYKTNLNP